MTAVCKAQGLTADWLNAWLAAIGVTVAVPAVKLSWSDEAVPVAVFHVPDDVDLPAEIARALPNEESLKSSVIALDMPRAGIFKRNVELETFRARAAIERQRHTTELASCVSDLRRDVDATNLDHGAFDPPAPKGETLWSRVVRCAKALRDNPEDVVDSVRRSLAGQPIRVQANGLGFDPRRLVTGVRAAGATNKVYVDPVVELLAFEALALFPTRGNGEQILQRGWRDRSTKRGAFRWAAWRSPMDRWAIDAFLDVADEMAGEVVARFAVVPFRPASDADPTRAYFGEAVP